MKLVCHGGECCGVKHIFGFQMHPEIGLLPKEEFILEEVEEQPYLLTAGAGWQQHSPGKNFFEGKAPQETALKRLDRYLKYIQKHQPEGLVEVVLNYYQKIMWDKYLKERGFNLVTEFRNSNTNAKLYVYHKVNKEGE